MNNTVNHLALLTLVHKRSAALINVLEGIERGTHKPAEVVVVFMNEAPYTFEGNYSFPIRSVVLSTEGPLNLAAARNLAMQESNMEYNVFLDVDCIPAKNFISVYAENLRQHPDALYSGRVRYLPAGFQAQTNWQQHLEQISHPDPVREELESFPYELFWSLNFGCTKSVFDTIGGFDAQYVGYGAEDTDFAFQARANNVPLHTLQATAYHQYHASYQPPLNHLESIVSNARRFAQKWQIWPMEGWLKAFEELGFLKKEANDLHILRKPSVAEIESALKTA